MPFRVIFSPYGEYSTPIETLGIEVMVDNLNAKRTRILPEKGNVGLHILDLYREKTGDDQVEIDDIPSVVESWRNEKYIEIRIGEETARSSGKFLESDTFYCRVSLDLMMEFETLDTLDDNTEEKKLRLSIDRDKILDEWIEQEYPTELQPKEEIEPEEN